MKQFQKVVNAIKEIHQGYVGGNSDQKCYVSLDTIVKASEVAFQAEIPIKKPGKTFQAKRR